MRAKATWLAALALGGGFLTACAEQTPVATPLPSAPMHPADVADNANEEHERQILRALSPHDPPSVEGLRLTSVGTGFFIAPESVLTNFHVAGDCTALTVGNNSEGEEVAATFTAGDPEDDLAVVSATEAGAKPARFQAELDGETGSGLAIVGYPEHGLPVLQAELEPVFASPADLLANRPNYPFSGAVRRGNSGSPVLDGSGAVVGIVNAKIDTVAIYRKTGEVVDDIGIAIANRTIFAFLRANNIAFQRVMGRTDLSPELLLQEAHSFVRQIGCWK